MNSRCRWCRPELRKNGAADTHTGAYRECHCSPTRQEVEQLLSKESDTDTHRTRGAHSHSCCTCRIPCASGLWSLDPLAYSNSILLILCREIDWHADRQIHGTHLTKCDRRNFASNLICPVVKCPSPFTVYSKCMLYTNSCLYVRRSCATARVVLKKRTSDEVAASIFWGNLLLHLSWKFCFIFLPFQQCFVPWKYWAQCYFFFGIHIGTLKCHFHSTCVVSVSLLVVVMEELIQVLIILSSLAAMRCYFAKTNFIWSSVHKMYVYFKLNAKPLVFFPCIQSGGSPVMTNSKTWKRLTYCRKVRGCKKLEK